MKLTFMPSKQQLVKLVTICLVFWIPGVQLAPARIILFNLKSFDANKYNLAEQLVSVYACIES